MGATVTVASDEVSALLLDRRLLVCRGPLVASHWIGCAVSFMHECCEDPACPQMRPVKSYT